MAPTAGMSFKKYNNNNTLTMSHSIAIGGLGRVSSVYNTI